MVCLRIGFSADNSFMQISKGIHLFFSSFQCFWKFSAVMVLDSWHEIYFFCLEPCGVLSFFKWNFIEYRVTFSGLCSSTWWSQETRSALLGKWWCRHTWKLLHFLVSFPCHVLTIVDCIHSGFLALNKVVAVLWNHACCQTSFSVLITFCLSETDL